MANAARREPMGAALVACLVGILIVSCETKQAPELPPIKASTESTRDALSRYLRDRNILLTEEQSNAVLSVCASLAEVRTRPDSWETLHARSAKSVAPLFDAADRRMTAQDLYHLTLDFGAAEFRCMPGLPTTN